MDERRSYYAVIPSNVRYDANLVPNAKLLYGEITALCNDKGYCWATNKYFADLYGTSVRTVQNWISSLEECGHIRTNLVSDQLGSKRFISIAGTTPPMKKSSSPPMKKSSPPHEKKFIPPHEKIFTHNNTRTNTTVNKSVSQSDKIICTDEQTNEIRKSLKKQIDYAYFETNYPEDLPGVNVLIDCIAEMLIAPSSRINGSMLPRAVIKPYIDKADSENVKGFLDHMRGKPMRDVKNIGLYWQSAFVNYIREEELVKLTL